MPPGGTTWVIGSCTKGQCTKGQCTKAQVTDASRETTVNHDEGAWQCKHRTADHLLIALYC